MTDTEAVKILRELEWSAPHYESSQSMGVGGGTTTFNCACPICRNHQNDGHHARCRLAAAIRSAAPHDEAKWVTLSGLCDATKLPMAWLRQASRDEKIPFIMAGRSMMFNLASARAALKAMESNAAQEPKG